MSSRFALPSLYIGTHADQFTEEQDLEDQGECHHWSPDEVRTPDSLVFFICTKKWHTPHPNWIPLPHLLDANTSLQSHMLMHGSAAMQQKISKHMTKDGTGAPGGLQLTGSENSFQLAYKLAKVNPAFRL